MLFQSLGDERAYTVSPVAVLSPNRPSLRHVNRRITRQLEPTAKGATLRLKSLRLGGRLTRSPGLLEVQLDRQQRRAEERASTAAEKYFRDGATPARRATR